LDFFTARSGFFLISGRFCFPETNCRPKLKASGKARKREGRREEVNEEPVPEFSSSCLPSRHRAITIAFVLAAVMLRCKMTSESAWGFQYS
jgi:hypothetical protein